MGTAAPNRRKHSRVRARGVAANLRAQEVLKTGCMVENISAGGLLVRTDQPLEVGTPVVMDLVRPGMKKMLKLSGRVVGVAERGASGPNSPPGLRVMFDPMPDETSERLNQLLKDLGGGSGLKASIGSTPPVPEEPPGGIVSGLAHEQAPTTWSSSDGLDTTRAMSMDALRSVLASVDEPSPLKELVEAALEPGEPEGPATPVPQIAPLTPLEFARPSPTPVPAAAPAADSSAADSSASDSSASDSSAADNRLMVQIRGLLMELGELQARLDARERELADALEKVDRLKAENGQLRQKLTQAEDRIWKRDSQ